MQSKISKRDNTGTKSIKKSLKIPKGQWDPYIEEEQTTKWPKENVQKDKQRSTKTKDRATRTPLKTGGELRCSGRVSISCSTSDTRRVNLVTNPVISHERGKDRKVFTTSVTYPWSFVTQGKRFYTYNEFTSNSFRGVRVTRSLVLYVCFVDRCLSFCNFYFRHCDVCSSSIYGS